MRSDFHLVLLFCWQLFAHAAGCNQAGDAASKRCMLHAAQNNNKKEKKK